MNILGISALDKESTASVIQNGQIVAAASEERFSRIKQQDGFPTQAIAEVCKIANISLADIDTVAYPFFEGVVEQKMRDDNMAKHLARNNTIKQPFWHKLSHKLRYQRIGRIESKEFMTAYDNALASGLAAIGISAPLVRYDHQLSHAASALYTSGFSHGLAITMDNYGSGATASVFIYENDKLKRLTTIDYPNSMGIFYALVTKNLGFKPDRHEGKILGLAAYGNPDILYQKIRDRFEVKHKDFFYKSVFHQKQDLRWASQYSREDVAAAYQKVLEEIVVTFIQDHLIETGMENIALAGGTFANVKLNQRIANLDMVKQIYIHPAMTDMGTGSGAALAHAELVSKVKPYKLAHSLFGPAYSNSEIQDAITKQNVEAEFYENIEEKVAQLLVDGAVIGRFNGAMEYGPRSLGNRSVLSRATDPMINKTLNDRLKRTEFMPFAPATIMEAADKCYIGLDKARHSAEFMTITFDCTAFMKEKSPAAVHVDGTARPQLVTKEANASFHRLISEYYKLTGIPSLINTSFNIHEEPIICSPTDAISTFQDGRLDYLSIGNYLIKCAT